MLLALVLMGILLGLSVPNYRLQAESVKKEKDRANRVLIEGAVQQFRLDTGVFPASVQDLLTAPEGADRWKGPYLYPLPVNPWDADRPYLLGPLGKAEE
jgi:general secretion pathway protein G